LKSKHFPLKSQQQRRRGSMKYLLIACILYTHSKKHYAQKMFSRKLLLFSLKIFYFKTNIALLLCIYIYKNIYYVKSLSTPQDLCRNTRYVVSVVAVQQVSRSWKDTAIIRTEKLLVTSSVYVEVERRSFAEAA
jgi:predicted membrane protein